jgi:Ca-activated chloride channel family protein
MEGVMNSRIRKLAHPAALPILTLLLAGLYCATQQECRLLTPDQRGYRAFEQGDYALASKRFGDPAWRGVALYRDGNFEQAALLFSQLKTPEEIFNHGNALVMQGLYEQAAERYGEALKLRPGWEAAERNLEIAVSRAKALEREGGNMTEGKLGADDIQFSDKPDSGQSGEEQTIESEMPANDASLQQIWLRQVQTRPADFLRSKFAYQLSRQQQESGQ